MSVVGFLMRVVMRVCSGFVVQLRCQSVISIKLLCRFIEATLRRWCFPVNLLSFLRAPLVGGPTEGCFCLLQRHYHHLLFILKAHLHIAITVMSMTHRFSKFYNFCWLFVTAVTFASAVFPIIEFDPNKLCFHHLEWATLRSILKSSFNNY